MSSRVTPPAPGWTVPRDRAPAPGPAAAPGGSAPRDGAPTTGGGAPRDGAPAPGGIAAPGGTAAGAQAGATRRILLDLPPTFLALVAEGAWIGVFYLLVQTARGEAIVLGPLSLAFFAGLGLVVARRFADRIAGAWAWAVVGMLAAAAITGWLLADPVRAALLRGDLYGAVTLHQAGLLAGLAFLRGTAHAVPAASERSLGRLVAWATPGLAIPLLLARAIDEPARSAFESQALVQCLLFILAATLALALTRVANLGRAAGFGWQRNRAWLAVAVGTALLAIVALPAAVLLGPVVRLMVALTLPPLLLVALVASLGTITLRAVAIVGAVGLVVFVISRLALDLAPNLQPAPVPPSGTDPNGQDPTTMVLTWLPIVAAVTVLIVFLVRRWLRRRSAGGPSGVFEQRWTEPGEAEAGLLDALRRRWRTSRRHRGAPADAIEAYLAALSDLERLPDLARAAAETPATHARRLRSHGVGALEVDLLAADYALARFGGTTLTRAEHRRALERWRRLRERIRRSTPGAPGPAA